MISMTSLTSLYHKQLPGECESKLAAHEAVTIAQSVLQDLLRGVSTPERAPSPVDAYLTEEDLFHYRNPRLHYQHRVVQNLHQLWQQYTEAKASQEEALNLRTPTVPLLFVEKPPDHSRTLASEYPQLQPHQEMDTLKDPKNSLLPQKTGISTKSMQRKSIMEEILVEEGPDRENTRSPRVLENLPPPKWNLCLEDFRQAVMTFPEELQREDALIQLNKAAMELCQEQKPLQSDLLYQMCLQLWRDVIDSLVSQSLWLRSLLGLPEKETVYLDIPDEGQKSPPVTEVKVTSGKLGKEDRRGGAQEKKQLSARDKEEKKGSKTPSKEDRLNSKKQKAKDDKKVVKSTSRDRLLSEDPPADSSATSQEPIDPLVMEKYTQRLYSEVYGLLDNLVIDMMVLADELGSEKNVEEPLRFCT